MEPLTHFLTGACIGRAGFNRKTRYATVVAVLAAEAADIDILWGFAGPVEELKHHRAITHTLVAAPVMAGIVVGVAWLAHRWRNARRMNEQRGTELAGAVEGSAGRGSQRVHWGWLYATAVVAALSHLALDWMNNYGLRPFYPFNPRWYAGSFMFIVEPVLYVLFALALLMPWLLGMADREMGVRRQPFRGRGWAVFALAAFAAVGCLRWEEHRQAISMINVADVTPEPIINIAAEPYPVNPFRWHAIIETKDYYQTAEVNSWDAGASDAIATDPQTDILYKPAVTPAVEAAKQTLLGQVYLDWTHWALVRDVGQQPEPALKPPVLPPGRTWTTVTFNDLRFDYSFLPGGSRSRGPLSGWVYIVDGREEAGEGMGDQVQR